MSKSISNRDEVIDSRDVIERIEELNDILINDYDEILGDELMGLEALANQGEDYSPDWKYGTPLIRDSYFEDYAKQTAEDYGLTTTAIGQWLVRCIDWTEATEQLRMDYTAVDFDGVTYWVR